MGRRTKLTPELQDKIVQIIQAGNYRSVAAAAVGIHPDTINQWMQRTRKPYIEFSEAVRVAEANAERMMVGQVMRAAAKEWRAALEYLSRKHPKRWAKREFTGALDGEGRPAAQLGSVLVVPTPMDEEAWVAAAARYKAIQPRAEEPADETE